MSCSTTKLQETVYYMAGSSSRDQRLRPLLPQPTPSIPSSPLQIAPRKRPHIRAACEPCHQRKSRCSGERPKCNLCVARSLTCHYETATVETRSQALKRKYSELQSRRPPLYEELFELMKSVSERDAHDILGRIRSGADVEKLLSHVANGDIPLQLAVTPETRYRYDFPYISKMPASLLIGDNPYLQSLIYEATAIYPSFGQYEIQKGSSWRLSTSSTSNSTSHSQQTEREMDETAYLKPFHAAEVVDPRLSEVKISLWTSVCDDDVLMRDLLRGWLRCEYHFTAAFQKDLFLEDMAAQREDFCSSLLVNIMLGYSCVCYPRFSNRAEYWNPQTLMYRFIAEARRIWELEANKPRITTIQAGMLFNVFYNLCGLDEVGQAYRIQAIALAHDMHLFKSAIEGQSERIRHGRAFTAWTLFNWETLVGFSFMFAPLLRHPPDWDLPDPSEDAEWYGEIWVKYPLSNHRFPSYFGQVFKARSQFRVIMNDACQAAFSKGEMNLGKANELLSRLKIWYNGLSGPLLPKKIVLPGHLQIHIYYHHLILSIFEPLLDAENDQGLSPRLIITDAKKHLQTLVRLYYLRHGYEAMDLFIVIPLMLAASDCIDAIEEGTPSSDLESLRSTLVLVAKGLYAQRRNHYLAEALFRVIRGRMRPVEASLFRGIMNIDGDQAAEKPDMAQVVRSHWPVSVVKKKGDLDTYILTNLVKNYAHLNIDGIPEEVPVEPRVSEWG